MTPADERRLQETYRREYRSLLQYVREASPYANAADRPLRDAVLRIATDEGDALTRFGDVLEDSRITLPYLGSFPVAFTDLNFVTIRHLLPKLVAEQKQDIAWLESQVPACEDVTARAAIQRLVDLHKTHSKELESLG
jgi:hypothetical protein